MCSGYDVGQQPPTKISNFVPFGVRRDRPCGDSVCLWKRESPHGGMPITPPRSSDSCVGSGVVSGCYRPSASVSVTTELPPRT